MTVIDPARIRLLEAHPEPVCTVVLPELVADH
jgi:hypothetical protein